MNLIDKFGGDHFIDGEWVTARGNGTFDSVNPATGETLRQLTRGGRAEIDAAVASSWRCFDNEWSRLGAGERGELLYRWANLMAEHLEEIALLDTLDSGKPIRDSRGSAQRGIKMLKFFAGLTDKLLGRQIPVAENLLNYTLHEPYGVVGAITPWNYPTTNFLTKVAPALACGNTIVVKPAEQTPLSALRLAELAVEAGLPKGTVNVVNGFGQEAGQALVAHPDVPKITFTGSTATGLHLTHATEGRVKSFTLELGGKTANVVFADSDLDAAVKAAAYTCFMNQGQTCTAGTRLLLEDTIADVFLERLLAYVKTLKVGDPLKEDTQIGAIVSASQFERIAGFVAGAKQEGAVLLCGGEPLAPAGCERGYFMAPTIFDRVTPGMKIFQQEIFGPVLSVVRFRDFGEAVDLANRTEYGLATTVWTHNLQKAHRFVQQAKSGIVWVNTVHMLHPASPYGGYKQSGLGTEMGVEIAHEYMRHKSAWIQLDTWKSPWQ
jgi:acyl-CoA reductase-like NAD-dependent aldehyde dehydrogenase